MCSTTMSKLCVLVALCFVCFLSFGFCVTFEAYKPYARTGEMTAESTDSASQIPAIHAPILPEKYGTPDTLETHASYEEELTIGIRTGAGWTEGQEGFPSEVNLVKVKESVVDLGEVDSTSFEVFGNQPTDSLTGELSSKNTQRPESSSSQRSGTKFNRASEEPPKVRATTMPQTSDGRVEVPSTVQTEVVDSLSNETDDKLPYSDYPETTFNSATKSAGRGRLSEKLHMAFNPSLVGNNPNRFFRIWNRKSKTSTQPTTVAVDRTSNDNDLAMMPKAQSFQQEFTSSKTSTEFEDLETDVESSATTFPASSELPECSKCFPEEQLNSTFESSTAATEATTLESLTTGATSVEFLTTEATGVKSLVTGSTTLESLTPGSTTLESLTTGTTGVESLVTGSTTLESLTTGSTRGPTTLSTTEVQESSEDDDVDDIDETDELLEYGPELWRQSSDPGLKSFSDEVTRKDLICTEIVLRSCLLEHLGLTFIDPENMTPREINRTCHHRFAINSCVRMGHKICNRSIPLFTGSYAVLNNLCRDKERHIKYMNSLPNRKRVSQPELERCMQALECQFMNITAESGLEKHFEDLICIDEHLRQFCHSLVWVKGHVTSLAFFEYCQHRLEVLYWMGFERIGCRPNADLVCFPPKKILDGDYQAMSGYVTFLLRRLDIA